MLCAVYIDPPICGSRVTNQRTFPEASEVWNELNEQAELRAQLSHALAQVGGRLPVSEFDSESFADSKVAGPPESRK